MQNAKDVNWLYKQPKDGTQDKLPVLRAYLRDTVLVIEYGAQSCAVDLASLADAFVRSKKGRPKKDKNGG